MKSFLAGLLEICVGLALLILAHEVVLRFLPVARSPAVRPPTAADPIQRYAPHQSFTWSLGWNFYVVVHGRINAQGFVANYDYRAPDTKPIIAVIGDSMVEALMVPYAETLTGRLQATIGDKAEAIAIAQSGSPLSQYVAYAAHACAAYRPQRLVVAVVGNDFDESVYANRVRDGIHHLYPRGDGEFELKLTPPAPIGLAERVARQSALMLYLVRNVGIHNVIANMMAGIGMSRAQAQTTAAHVGGARATTLPARIAEGEKVIAWFLDALPRAACLAPSQIVLAVDAIRPQLYDEAQLAAARSTYFGLMRAEILSKAAAKGFVVLDLEAPFRADFKTSRQPFEFPTDGHWNSHAHSVVATEVRMALGNWP